MKPVCKTKCAVPETKLNELMVEPVTEASPVLVIAIVPPVIPTFPVLWIVELDPDSPTKETVSEDVMVV